MEMKRESTFVLAQMASDGYPEHNLEEAKKALKEAARTVDIALLDHIIVAGKNYYSFSDHSPDNNF